MGTGVFARTHSAVKLQRAKIKLVVNEVRFTTRSRCVFYSWIIKRDWIKLNITGQFRSASNLVKR